MALEISSVLARQLGIKYPIMLAGMANVSKATLAAAVSNAGGLGVIGGALISPKALREDLTELKKLLRSPDLPFGVDLLLPKVGGGARKTNYDYTRGTLKELVDICIEFGAAIFVCAVGVPPKWVVDRFHAAGVMVMNMVGSPKHVPKALSVGVDAICAQGTEAGGHTGDVATLPLIPQCVDLCRGHTSPLHGTPVAVVGAGGIYDGRGMAAAMMLGAQAVWVGTRFVATEEASAGPRHKNAIVQRTSDETVRTLIYSGRPMRVYKSDYIRSWETERRQEQTDLLKKGKLPYKTEFKAKLGSDEALSLADTFPIIFGQACGGINGIKRAGDVVREMASEAAQVIHRISTEVLSPSRL